MEELINKHPMQTILLTWATWYIGSHWAVALLEKWYNVIIVDNLSNSSKKIIKKINEVVDNSPLLQRRGARGEVKFYEIDLRNKEKLEKVFIENEIDSVIHFAWAKAVWESCEKPFYYYENNIVWSLNLFELMDKFGVKNIIFSSSATVYMPDTKAPITEDTNTWNTTNPYWTTKLIIENLLRDLSNHKWFNVVNLRYFNPVWAHKSWLIWEDPNDIPNNLLPYIMKVANWELEEIHVFGNDYPTKDGTWERDYIHVLDLIDWHIKALEYIKINPQYIKRLIWNNISKEKTIICSNLRLLRWDWLNSSKSVTRCLFKFFNSILCSWRISIILVSRSIEKSNRGTRVTE